MADVAELLQRLHPMREPPPPAPVAPFVLMLAGGIALALVLFATWYRLSRRRAGLRRSAEAALAATRALPPPERLAAQATLLRRVVRERAGVAAARGSGEAWLATLDRTFATSFFSQGAGRAFAEDLYRRDGAGDIEALDHSLSGCFARLGAPRRGEAAA